MLYIRKCSIVAIDTKAKRENARSAICLSDLIIEVDVFMVLYIMDPFVITLFKVRR